MPRYPHTEIRQVSCVPDVNRLPEIQTYRSRAPTGTSRGGDGRVSRELEEDQVLSSRGARLPQCPGGVGQLATLVLGDGGLARFSLSINVSPRPGQRAVIRPLEDYSSRGAGLGGQGRRQFPQLLPHMGERPKVNMPGC